ncbi:hypothetical protein TNIN_226631 [Trichonephila inaurata madagascariensis]|uniref:Uncharacterized protein n=1 Tax=Trichonephila inaurata madagascariensis TaxID=2747483 RepID=A0A8X6XZT1_9ARAC|nr:hypothetical protein TNIN_226631 [Trichonephila inaurata madagascariensis]
MMSMVSSFFHVNKVMDNKPKNSKRKLKSGKSSTPSKVAKSARLLNKPEDNVNPLEVDLPIREAHDNEPALRKANLCKESGRARGAPFSGVNGPLYFYATDTDGKECYPKDENGDEYYIWRVWTHVLAKLTNGDEYYAKDHFGTELYPRRLVYHPIN